jgi:hypothetical protein
MPTAIQRPDYRLSHNLWAEDGAVFLTGTQALVRLLLMQRARDAAAGLNTAGFVSGYRGSPLGMLDMAIWKAGREVRGRRHPLRAGDQRRARRHPGAGHAARGVRPGAHARRRVRDVVRQGPGCGPRGRRTEAWQCLRLQPAWRRAGGGRRRPWLRQLVDAAPERRRLPGLAPARRRAGQCGRVPGVRPLWLGAVALQRQLGRLHGPVRSRRKRRHGGPGPDQRPRRRLGRWRHGARRQRPPRAGRRPALPLARPAFAAHRDPARRQAGGGGRVCAHQQHRPPGHRFAGGALRHRHRGQGALRPDGGAAPAGDHARHARRRRCAPVQGGSEFPRSRPRAWRPSPRVCRRSWSSKRRHRSSRRSCASCSTTRRSVRSSSARRTLQASRW